MGGEHFLRKTKDVCPQMILPPFIQEGRVRVEKRRMGRQRERRREEERNEGREGEADAVDISGVPSLG